MINIEYCGFTVYEQGLITAIDYCQVQVLQSVNYSLESYRTHVYTKLGQHWGVR